MGFNSGLKGLNNDFNVETKHKQKIIMKIRGFRSNTDEDSSLCDVAPYQLVKMATFRRLASPDFQHQAAQEHSGDLEEQ
jgi:hypothetical protein